MLAGRSLPEEAIERRRSPAIDAEGRIAPPLAEQEDVRASRRQRLDLVDRAQAAAMHSRARAVGPERPLGEGDGIGGLEDLDRRNRRHRDRIVAVIEAVRLRIAPEAAAEEREHHPGLSGRPALPASDSALIVPNGAAVARSGIALASAPKMTPMTRRIVSV